MTWIRKTKCSSLSHYKLVDIEHITSSLLISIEGVGKVPNCGLRAGYIIITWGHC